jgi:hypothetical protein
MTPRSRGGTNGAYNLVMACRGCNGEKGGRTVEEYRTVKGGRRFFGEDAVAMLLAIESGARPLLTAPDGRSEDGD